MVLRIILRYLWLLVKEKVCKGWVWYLLFLLFRFNSLPPGKFSCFLSSADFFENQLFQKFLSGIPPECQIVWIQIRPNILSGLILVQTVCKSYQQTALKEAKSYCV